MAKRTRPTLAEIREAHARIRPHIHCTPVVTCETLDRMTGCELHFKCENLQKAGAFKSRGACNAVLCLSDAEAAHGVVTHSSGNHAAALARAARIRGIEAHIVMPSNSPDVKVEAVRGYGGRIIFCEPNQPAREATASRVQLETGATMIHPYDDVRIIAGQGTAVIELLEDVPSLDAVMTPVGGGGLLSGTLIAGKGINPALRIVAAEPANADDSFQGWKRGQYVPSESPDTIADGLKTGLGKLTLPIIHELVDDILLAKENAIREALLLILERAKLVIEPSSAVPLAALLTNEHGLAGQRIGIILSGGNIDLRNFRFA
ncbi:MAG: pyridoxal-phosphate dependent enzyme [Planctomycetota bacterium]|nr:pyridoxal-phosphate dependent enzyme [Planctomycetota bacterium]